MTSFEKLGPVIKDPKLQKRRTSMNENERVLIRRTARELTAEEVELATGAVRTLTACTIDELCCKDGDASIGEC